MKIKKRLFIKNQRGLVSLIVTVILMLVLTIIVIGFSTIMRREQRQTLDRQLSTQAFYAAESGINDAVAKLNSLPLTNPIFTSNFTDCTGGGGNDFVAQTSLNRTVSFAANVSYSCLLVNTKLQTLDYSNIDETPHIIPIVTPSGNINTITINWQAKDGTASFCTTFPDLPPAASWGCSTGLLRLDVVNTSGSISRDSLNRDVRTAFLYPQIGAASPATPPAFGTNTGQVIAANCNSGQSPKYCGVTIDVSGFTSGQFYLRLSSLYAPSAVSVCANNGGGSCSATLIGAQAVIDSTGKANDVLRRVQARVSINPLGKGPFPGAAIQSADSICKRLYTIPPNIVDLSPADGSVSNPANQCGLN